MSKDQQSLKQIRKRDGSVVSYDRSKIESAIEKALRATEIEDPDLPETLTQEVQKYLSNKAEEEDSWIPSVEEVQDLVERVLIENDLTETAKAYILYRRQHQEIRQVRDLMSDLSMVEGYLDEESWRVKENSNMSYSLQGLNIHITERVVSSYWLEKIYPPSIRDAHKEGDFHIHDLGTLGPYCVGWDLQDLLMNGFKGVRGKIESAPARHFRVALMHVVNFMYTLQGEAAGAQAFSHLDTYLAPFIRHDGLNYDQVKQAMQEFIFNMNVPTRTGFQTPFTNITLDLTIPNHLEDQNVIMGGEIRDGKYGDYQEEMETFNRAFAEVMLEGDSQDRPFTFPIPTYNITKDFEWGREVLDPIWKMTAKYGIPYFSNFVTSDMNPEDSRSMCCRLRLDNRELRKRGGGLFGSNPLTGSIGVVTLNLPRIGLKSSTEETFLEKVGELMDLAKESLVIKRKALERFTENGLYPYSRFYLRTIKESADGFWKNHFSTIGLVGMNDALLNFMDTDIGTRRGRQFAEKVLQFMREKLRSYQEDTGDMFNLEATPAEGTSYRLAKIDKERHPHIQVYNEDTYGGDAPYYTNSTQLPVGYTDDIFEALELQDQLQSQYTGGTVFHGFLGEAMPNPDATRRLVKKVAENYSLPYYTLTPTFSVCPDHGYLNGEQPQCPRCGKGTEVYSRIVGYIRPVEHWNKGKRQEFEDRREFEKPRRKAAQT
ncbi:MAG: ribonucleoside triphosphate reductase [Candidatus Bipolaricaulota bacterium]